MRYLILMSSLFFAAACSGGGGDAARPEDTVGGDAPSDTTPPEFRDVRVEIHASPSIIVDLNNQDVERVLPMAFPAAFTVFTTDDESVADAIVVTVLQGDEDVPADGQEAAFANGIWTVAVPGMGPGQTWRVRVEDEAGNADVWTYALIIPTLDEAVVGDWDTRWYTEEGVHSHSWEAAWSTDGTWEESRAEPTEQVEGTWAIDGDLLTVSETTSQPGDPDPDTVEVMSEGGFYVDETYLSTVPMHRTGEGDGLEGTWSRDVLRWPLPVGEEFVAGDVTETLALNGDGTCEYRVEGSQDPVSDYLDVVTGTWVLVPNENYIENYGDYLVIVHETRNGEPLDPPAVVVDLMVIRHDLLLLSPKVRAF